MHMPFYDRFLEKLAEEYPDTARSIDLKERISPLLICPTAVPLPSSLLEQARTIAEAFFALRNLEDRKRILESEPPPTSDPGNLSALMSFDFHLDSTGQLRLIEINTNASMALMTDLIYKTHGLDNRITSDFARTIADTFQNEFRLCRPDTERSLATAAIADEAPENQRLYIEFLLYRELFERHGIKTRIADTRAFAFQNGSLILDGIQVDLVYNRHTDFYFETPETAELKKAFESRSACVSPNPHEYRLLADKARLEELSVPGAISALPLEEKHKQAIERTLIRTVEVASFSDKDALWAERKHWFFKPKRSFGGKAAYRGSATGRTVFTQIVSGDYLAQEYVPPGTMELEPEQGEGKKEEFKYDLRFFAYGGEIQLACARLFKGQMTNTQTPGGGVAAIKWV